MATLTGAVEKTSRILHARHFDEKCWRCKKQGRYCFINQKIPSGTEVQKGKVQRSSQEGAKLKKNRAETVLWE
ncbi:MAG: hypothetical protein Q6367_003280 [Candidatus Freyarchaeota archaeon]